jgi:hypothetical protein
VTNDATLQNFIYKHIIDVKMYKGIKKQENGEFARVQFSSNYMQNLSMSQTDRL